MNSALTEGLVSLTSVISPFSSSTYASLVPAGNTTLLLCRTIKRGDFCILNQTLKLQNNILNCVLTIVHKRDDLDKSEPIIMVTALTYGVLGFILVMLVNMTYHFNALKKNPATSPGTELQKAGVQLSQNFLYTALVLTVILIILYTWYVVRGTPWEGHLLEWLNLVVRLMHVTFGIAWIGASFYFVFLENALNRKENLRDEIAADLWAVHGGGLYYLEK